MLTRWRCLALSLPRPPSCPGPGAGGRAPCCGLSPIYLCTLCTLVSILPLWGWPLELRMEFKGAGTRSGECGTTALPFF